MELKAVIFALLVFLNCCHIFAFSSRLKFSLHAKDIRLIPVKFLFALHVGFSLNYIEAAVATDKPLYGLQNGRVLTCARQSNCLSTSSVNSIEKYARPWFYGDIGENQAWKSLLQVLSSSDLLNVAEVDDEKFYVR